MKVQSLLLCSILCCCILMSNAQEITLPEITPPSPTVANLMAFEEVPIDYYTGQPNISIPLFSKSLSSSAGLNVGLKYHTSGIKVENISGWTGTGWSLDIGGVISRTVRGTPDEDRPGLLGNSKRTGVLQNDAFWNYNSLSDEERGEFNWNAVGSSSKTYDTQLDLYQFSLFGISGRFVVVKENGVLVPKLLSRDQNVKIILQPNDYNSDYIIDQFKIIDAYGYQYTFDVIEYEESDTFTVSVPQGFVSDPDINASGIDRIIKNRSAWHLSEVATSNGIVLASIAYQQTTHNYLTSLNITTNDILTNTSNISAMIQNAYNTSIMKPKRSQSYYSTIMTSQKPSVVTFKDGTSIQFVTQNGHPENNGVILKDVIMRKEDGSENKRFSLSYETTASNNRLWLTKVSEIAGNITLETNLVYNNKELLPGFDENSFSDDIWGYYNGAMASNMTSSSCLDYFSFDKDKINTGLLTSIIYPTGGSKDFTFENNSFSYIGTDVLGIEDYQTNPENTTLLTPNQLFEVSNTGLGNGFPISPQTITIDHEQEIYISSTVEIGTAADVARFRIKLLDTSSGMEYTAFMGDKCVRYLVPPGTYSFGIFLLDGLTVDPFYIKGHTRLYYTELDTTLKEYLYGGGVRIKEISFHDPNLQLGVPQRRFSYSYQDSLFPNKSSGVVDSKIGNLAKDYTTTVTKFLFGGEENVLGSFSGRDIQYRVRSKGLNGQMTKGGFVGYRTVEVTESGNGKSVYRYTSPYDYPSPSISLQYPFPPKENNEYKRGLLKRQEVYDNTGRILKETMNETYEFVSNTIAPSFNVYDTGGCSYSQFYSEYVFYKNRNGNQNIPQCGGDPCILLFDNCGLVPYDSYFNDLTDSWAQLKESISKEYFYEGANQKVVETRQTFDYNPQNFQQSVVERFTNENGMEEHYKTELFYPVGGTPSNYEGDPLVTAKMLSLNMINLPLYTQSSLDGQVLSHSQNIYEEFSTDKVDLKEVKTEKTNLGIDNRMVYQAFDTHGNPLEVSLADGPPISYVWGHYKTLPVASIQNATSAEVNAALNSISGLNLDANGLTLAQATSLRNGLANALVTTYTYDPLVGVTSVTDPRGYTMYYEYDEFNRLQYVRDADNNLISENQYNYKNQN